MGDASFSPHRSAGRWGMVTTAVCEARSTDGARCQHVAVYTVQFHGEECHLCGMHMKIARQRSISLVAPDDPVWANLPRARAEWTAEDDDYLLVNPGLSADEAARHLGRTPNAVTQRRFRLRAWARDESL